VSGLCRHTGQSVGDCVRMFVDLAYNGVTDRIWVRDQYNKPNLSTVRPSVCNYKTVNFRPLAMTMACRHTQLKLGPMTGLSLKSLGRIHEIFLNKLIATNAAFEARS
jgi:hypothetical protein